MLPSTGYFKGINCPFYESGLCERPYCHFRHVKREPEVNNEPLENGEILQQLVSEAVKKVLLHTDTSSFNPEGVSKSQSIITKVVQELNPSTAVKTEAASSKVTYNPTPISELNKLMPNSNIIPPPQSKKENNNVNRKHIPVPYTPHRPSRSQIMRAPSRTSLTSIIQVSTDTYSPTAISQDKSSEESAKYLPGSIGDHKPAPYCPGGDQNTMKNSVGYTPSDLSNVNSTCLSDVAYTPTGQSVSSVSYNPGSVSVDYSTSMYCPKNISYATNVGDKSPCYSVSYKPTPLNEPTRPTFSSDEDEPNIKKSKSNDTGDLQEMEGLDSEFEMLGQILDDENANSTKPADTVSNKRKIKNQCVVKASSIRKSTEILDNLTKTQTKNLSVSEPNQNLKQTLKHKSSLEKTDMKEHKKIKTSDTDLDSLLKEQNESHKSSKTETESSKSSSHDRKSKYNSDSKSSKQDSNDKSHTSKKDDGRTLSKDKENDRVLDKSKSSSISKSTSSQSKSLSKSQDPKDSEKSKSSSHTSSSHREKSRSSSKSRHDSKSKTSSDSKSDQKDSKSKSSSHSIKSQHSSRSKSSSDKCDSKSKTSEKHSNSHRDSSSSSSKSKYKDKDRSSKRDSGGKSSKTSKEKRREKDRDKKEKNTKAKESKEEEFNKTHSDSVSDNELIEEISESDEETITQECMKICEEYVPSVKETISQHSNKQDDDPNSDLNQASAKKRVAHNTNYTIYRSPSTVLPNHKSKALSLAADRYSKVKQFHNERLKNSNSEAISVSQHLPARVEPSVSVSSSSSKVRIAHVPNVSTLLNAKKALVVPELPKSTPTQTVTRGTNRVAHMPNDKFCERPSVLEPLASKIAVNIRSKYLNLMIDECLKIYLTPEDAYARAQQEELNTQKKCTAIPIYKNSSLLTISRLRKEIQEAGGVKINSSDSGQRSISHNQVLLGKLGQTVSWSIENKHKKDSEFSKELQGPRFYENISRWVLTEEELRENGFPRPHPEKKEKGVAKIYTQNTRQKPQKGFIRWCCRCKKEYTVDKKGIATAKQECIYHPNNKYRFRGEVKYQCCGQDTSSDGCLSASCHVYEYVDHENLRGFVTTLPKDRKPSNHGVYALDCEMSYTTNGLDLTRVTVIDSNLSVVYETLVKPIFPIIDYNTKYSGITEEQMTGITTTLLEVQATLLHMFSDKTILVGHSLESDFKALKLIHNTVVDTSVLFPHKMGPPYKRALRNLTSEHLKKIIQNSLDGHDSAEDATVCMELIIWKLKEEFKTR